ncbi:MAG: hypothetical protein HY721_18395 [Planctomycetes bacterium]|nr:hypothetical protein [Planctomycetota bacterium]
MRKYVLGLLTCAVVVTCGAPLLERPAGAAGRETRELRESLGSLLWVGEAGEETETVAWRGLKGAARSAPLQRLVLKVPQSYGKAVAFEDNEVWFEAEDGTLRNIVLGPRLVRIEREK